MHSSIGANITVIYVKPVWAFVILLWSHIYIY